MQIILLEKVANLGTLGDIVKVKAGYARNFLIPNGKAKRATEANMAEFEQRRAELEKAANEISDGDAGARQQARRVDGAGHPESRRRRAPVRLGHQLRHLRGAQGSGLRSAKGAVRLPHGPLKQVGDYDIVLDLHTDVKANDQGVGAGRAVTG